MVPWTEDKTDVEYTMFAERSLVFRCLVFLILTCCTMVLPSCAVHPAQHPFETLDTNVTALSSDCVQITAVDNDSCHELSWWSAGADSACADRGEMLTTIEPSGSCPGGITFPAVVVTCCLESNGEPPGPFVSPDLIKALGTQHSIPGAGWNISNGEEEEEEALEEEAEEDDDDDAEKAPFMESPKKKGDG